jgi:hypothetical protein
MKEIIKVEGHPGFIRNADNNVILNINKTEIEIARERKKLRKQKENEFEELKNEVSEIKGLLLKLIEKQ